MGFFDTWFITPFSEILTAPIFFFEVVLGGLMAGVMYSMVALGFVLIFKASGVFNFAQGIDGAVRRPDARRAAWSAACRCGLALPAHHCSHGGCSPYVIERLVLRPLVNQEPLTLLHGDHRADLFPRGSRQSSCGAATSSGSIIGIPDDSFEFAGMLLNEFELFAALTAGVLWSALLAVLSQKTAIGRALRAVADDHQAAAVGRHPPARRSG